ncbi:unnamed protein product, partial [Leptidea sinapis]
SKQIQRDSKEFSSRYTHGFLTLLADNLDEGLRFLRSVVPLARMLQLFAGKYKPRAEHDIKKICNNHCEKQPIHLMCEEQNGYSVRSELVDFIRILRHVERHTQERASTLLLDGAPPGTVAVSKWLDATTYFLRTDASLYRFSNFYTCYNDAKCSFCVFQNRNLPHICTDADFATLQSTEIPLRSTIDKTTQNPLPRERTPSPPTGTSTDEQTFSATTGKGCGKKSGEENCQEDSQCIVCGENYSTRKTKSRDEWYQCTNVQPVLNGLTKVKKFLSLWWMLIE